MSSVTSPATKASASSPLAKASADGMELSRLAKQVPKPRVTGDELIDAQRRIQHMYMVELIDVMAKKPETIMALHGLYKSHDLSMISQTKSAPASWTGKYKQVERLPKQWMSEFLLRRSKALNIDAIMTHKKLSDLAVADPDLIARLFYFDTQVVGTIALPAELNDQSVCSQVFHMRAVERGNRLKHFVEAGGLSTDGQLNFSTGGCFKLTFAATGDLTELRHCSGAIATVPDHIKITSAYRLVDNHLDHLSKVVNGPAKYSLSDFFDNTQPWKNHMVETGKKFKRLASLATEVLQSIAQQEEASKNTFVGAESTVLEAATKKRRTDNLEKARAKLEEKKHARVRSRTLSLSEPAPLAPIAPLPE